MSEEAVAASGEGSMQMLRQITYSRAGRYVQECQPGALGTVHLLCSSCARVCRLAFTCTCPLPVQAQ
jgi:hypothetical protein